jgi:MtN3 and saliva related transmembrane protein
MTTTDVLAVGATVAGLVMAVSPSLQVRRMLQTRSSRDVSIGYLSMLCVGFVLWISYGVALGNAPMMLTNSASFTFMVATIGVALYFRRSGAAPEPVAGGGAAAK